MRFSVIMIALFSTLAVAAPEIYENLAPRGSPCGEGCSSGGSSSDACCVTPGENCCYVCKDGSDSDCAPEVTERSIFGITE
ncbi:hypothetical protein VTL71DRAFT_9246 [Oculimacula yallundae]|uniref:Uncharacterized protein n=1 Tax=Oculimacula yallundae TaxID=86028 RepID=A0ABR4BSH9_9HELO